MKLFRLLTLTVSFAFPCVLIGQSTNASLTGVVDDPSKAAISGVSITAINTETDVKSSTTTNGSGQYVLPGLIPGSYRVEVDKQGFKGIIESGLVLHVQDVVQLNFHMAIGSMSETVSVSGDSVNVNTTDGSVSTVIDRQFVENLPLNGRSFQALLYLTPGVSLNVGAGPSNTNNPQSQGQFVVNGQRSDANYWMVDGVSANIGISALSAGNGVAGGIGGTNALGGTSALVSVDAMQEFRVITSTYSPEYGRQPGGQISIQTRSGTNEFHGDLFEYLRNTDLDAKDWFSNYFGLRKSAEIQNDFGGVLGGPILKDKTFFFFSAESLRLLLPSTFLGTVPDIATRQAAIPAMQPYVNAYPLPQPGAQEVPGNLGLVTYTATFSQPDSADAYSLRVDHQLLKNLNIFARYNQAPSSTIQRGADRDSANTYFSNNAVIKTATAGATWTASANIVNDLRLNYSASGGKYYWVTDDFGGGTPTPGQDVFPSPFTYKDSFFILSSFFGSNMYLSQGYREANYQHQYNLVDTLSVQKGAHSLKLGVDYRRLTPSYTDYQYFLATYFGSARELDTGSADTTLVGVSPRATFLLHNLGLFAQDTWRIGPRLNLTYGLRWDVDFAPKTETGPPLPAITGFSTTNLSGLALAPAGTPIYATRYGNVAPRVGGAYRLSTDPNWGVVLRGGFGVFYGLASTDLGNTVAGYNDYPYEEYEDLSNIPFPTPPSYAEAPAITPPSVANQVPLTGYDPHLNLPYTLEWNVALEQSLGSAQTFTLSYIGASGRRQLETESINNPNPNYATANLVGNAGVSNYAALQLQFQRRLAHGLQALLGYTWSHSIDNASYGAYANGSLADVMANRGDSDYDLRNVFSAALTYNAPEWRRNTMTRLITGGWSTDDIVQFRSGPPLDVNDNAFVALLSVNSAVLIRPDIVPGQPKYLNGSQYPGRKALNPASFTDPPVDPITGLPTRQGNLQRNARRALGISQWDFAAHREFSIYERLKLQFRAELFNILNHPNFGPFDNNFGVGDPFFGQSTQMLNQYLGGLQGSGTQNPLYTPGSPRSGELALKLVF